jgi:hypothetical protein
MSSFSSRLLFLLLSCSFCTISEAQTFTKDYKPLRDYRPSPVLIDEIEAGYKKTTENLPQQDKKVRQMIKESIGRLSRSVTMRDSFSALMHTDSLTTYITGILNRIQAKNSLLQGNDYHIFTYRTSVPNASNSGNGVVMINLDLVSKLNTEQELAFIICHELAHDLQKHVMNGITNRATQIYDKDFQKKLKEVSKQEFNRRQETEYLVTSLLEQFSEHSRENELQADSLGLILFHNAGYAPLQAVNGIYMLDSIDYPVYYDRIKYEQFFNFNGYPFRPEWLGEDANLTDIGGNLDDRKIPDELKTHPGCAERAEALQRITETQKLNSPVKESVIGNYHYYREIARFEELEMLMFYDSYGEALYTALQMQTDYPNNIYLKCAAANSLYEISKALQDHRFSKVVDTQDDECTQSYYEFLGFLHNLSSSELKEITRHYYAANVQSVNVDNAYTGYLDALIKSLDVEKTEYPALLEAYKKDYNDAYYTKLLTTRLNLNNTKK